MYFNNKTSYLTTSSHPTDASQLHDAQYHEWQYKNSNLYLQNSHVVEASAIANNDILFDFFNNNLVVDSSNDNSDMTLPQGWKMTRRKRSIFELDTNIHTLSELYNSLVDLRNQLPDPIAMEVEMPFRKPSLLTSRSSIDETNFITRSRSGSSAIDFSSPTGNLSHPYPGEDIDVLDNYYRLFYTYPDFIFELLMHTYLDCISFTRVQPKKLLEQHRQGKLDKAYTCAVYAYGALHAILCHPEKFGVYSFMNQLSIDAYQVAYDLVEFDAADFNTIETLVIMSQYLITTGREGEAKNLFEISQRQISMLMADEENTNQDAYRLFIWMVELDWMFSLSHFCSPNITLDQMKESLYQLKPSKYNDDDEIYVRATRYKIKGLNTIVSSLNQQDNSKQAQSKSPFQKLNHWRSQYLEHFLYKRVATQPYTVEDKLALRLHAIYFAGMLELHKQHMLSGFELDLQSESKTQWTDYFHSQASTSMENQQFKVEKGLYRSMNAAYGFIQVIRLLLDEKDRCILPQMIDTLSTACTVLYFGNKVIISDVKMIQKSKEALAFVVHAFLTSTTYSMIECPRIDNFIKKWSPLMMK